MYVATTAATGCLLGVGVSDTADAAGLTQAYGEFQQEAMMLNPDYTPESVNTDGWKSTQIAWKTLFPRINLMLCFLHTVLGIQQSCRRARQFCTQITDKLWHLYKSCDRRCFGQRLRQFLEWADTQELSDTLQQKIQKLRHKAPAFKLTFELPDAYRTSNQVDRLINYQERVLNAMQYFHGTKESMQQGLRAMALLWNFHPYGRKVQRLEPYSNSSL